MERRGGRGGRREGGREGRGEESNGSEKCHFADCVGRKERRKERGKASGGYNNGEAVEMSFLLIVVKELWESVV